jgi:hypothetical protein
MPDPLTDPIRFVETLSADALVERLDQLDREKDAIRVLLRSVRARQSAANRRQAAPQKQQQEAAHAG